MNSCPRLECRAERKTDARFAGANGLRAQTVGGGKQGANDYCSTNARFICSVIGFSK
jgi:hypothetical protein